MKLSAKQHDEIIGRLKTDFDLSETSDSDNRQQMVDDLRFAALDQWPDEVKRERKGRPMLTLDHVGQTIRKITGDIRQSMPVIRVSPVDSGSDKATADVLESLIRQIQSQSRAESVYGYASEMAVKCGFGAFMVTTDYTSHDVFEQDICIKRIANPFACRFDPASTELNKQDGRFCILSQMIPLDQYKAQYGDDPTDWDQQGEGEAMESWFDGNMVRIAQYWVKEKIKRKILLLSDGATIDGDEVTDQDIEQYRAVGIHPVRERTADSFRIMYYKCDGKKVLESSEWKSRYFPLIPVYGIEENIEGRVTYRGVVRAAKDPQRLYNYWNSAAAEAIALQPKAPFILTPKQIKGQDKFWNGANNGNFPYLIYNPDEQAPGPPQRQMPPVFQAGLMQHAAVASDDIKSATGVYDASLGQRSNETSGIAIQARQSEAELGASVFLHNLAYAIETAGKIIIDLIPTYYDTVRIVKIRGEDGSEDDAMVNAPVMTPDGLRIKNDLTRGKYDVSVDVGPNFKTKRAEAAASMIEAARVFPQLIQVAGDLVAKNLDWPGADEIAERLKKTLPPGIAELTPEEQQQQAGQLQQQQAEQMAALQAQMQQLAVEMENKQADTDAKRAKAVRDLAEAEAQKIENNATQSGIIGLIDMLSKLGDDNGQAIGA